MLQLQEVIRCSRPATVMPYHDKAAYTDDRCYGITAAELGADLPPLGVALRESEIAAIAGYIAAEMKGRGPVTRDVCLAYFGADADCSQY